jgi:hypothetical protein
VYSVPIEVDSCIADVHRRFDSHSHFAWIDFGVIKGIWRTHHILPTTVSKPLGEKIIISTFSPPDTSITYYDLLSDDEPRIAGGTFVVPRRMIDTLEKLSSSLLGRWLHDLYCDDDQSAMFMLYSHNSHLFRAIRYDARKHHRFLDPPLHKFMSRWKHLIAD